MILYNECTSDRRWRLWTAQARHNLWMGWVKLHKGRPTNVWNLNGIWVSISGKLQKYTVQTTTNSWYQITLDRTVLSQHNATLYVRTRERGIAPMFRWLDSCWLIVCRTLAHWTHAYILNETNPHYFVQSTSYARILLLSWTIWNFAICTLSYAAYLIERQICFTE